MARELEACAAIGCALGILGKALPPDLAALLLVPASIAGAYAAMIIIR